MSEKILPVILCGGGGTRLWPYSRKSLPKQFLNLIGGRSTFQITLDRVSDKDVFLKPLVITGHDYGFMAKKQIEEAGTAASLLLEPEGRDSGPAIAAAAHWAQANHPDAHVLILAADHMIEDVEAFGPACRQSTAASAAGYIVTFGVQPTFPATGYGYIKPGRSLNSADGACRIEKFVEKPDAETARTYISDGYLWNSGNFVFRPETLLSDYERVDPATVETVRGAIDHGEADLGSLVLDAERYGAAKKLSIDYAVMEKTEQAAVLPVGFAWSDIGDWNALWSRTEKDDDGNASEGRAVFLGSKNSYVVSDRRLLTTVLGLEDVVVVSTQDAVLVADRSRTDEVKELVANLKSSGHAAAEQHLREYRPWGWYETRELGHRFQVKRIHVDPGQRLSLQKHYHRAEHWVVVTGTALVTIDDETRVLRENESVYIPLGSVHRLENPGKIDLELIEIQSGSYLGEDDIVRLDDDYRRG